MKLSQTKLIRFFDKSYSLQRGIEHWREVSQRGQKGIRSILSERWLQETIMLVRLGWRFIYDLAKVEIDFALGTADQEGQMQKNPENEGNLADNEDSDMEQDSELSDSLSGGQVDPETAIGQLKTLKAFCEHLDTIDLEKFEDFDDDKIAGILDAAESALKIKLQKVLKSIPSLDRKLSADRLMASLAKNLTPAQLEAIEHQATGEENKLFDMIGHYFMAATTVGPLLSQKPPAIYDQKASKLKPIDGSHILNLDYVDLDEDRVLHLKGEDFLLYDGATKQSALLPSISDYRGFKLLGHTASKSKAYFTCKDAAFRSYVGELRVPARGPSTEIGEAPFLIGNSEQDDDRYLSRHFALHRDLLVALEHDLEKIRLAVWKLGDERPSLKMLEEVDDLCIIDESSRDLFQEFKSLNIYTRRTAMIANSRQALIAVHIYSDYDYDSFGKTRIAGLCLAGVNFETKSHLALSKLEFETSLDRDAINYDYHLFKLKSKANTLACLSLDSRAGKCIVQALTGQKIVKILERPLPRRFPRLESDFQFMQVFCQRLMKMTFWRVEKRESKFKLMAYSWKVNL